ncbi:uncharacterized protein PFL1_01034 [Pseudozyma flocculosa PF-1]|uniref:Related to HST1 - silencing protein n=1 Tax=Pseudozyma flocculosa TaxID=84751 RepID=A0A5C3F8Q4_9BASI|nr:uncharacterized protein PFL1_01034 [Pseudozyma flocculosa PF-1]EPQ31701.1 hypothetical protein PFL1_01034 [Pseudozyma flocculosa PF-1]SPO40818.1 related to HST1 - silencing protein [Pseudozyma flocculosa]
MVVEAKADAAPAAATAGAPPSKEIPNTEVRPDHSTVDHPSSPAPAAATATAEDGPRAPPALPSSHAPGSPTLSELDSEELEELEAFAEAEASDDEGDQLQDRFLDEVTLLFPPEKVEGMVQFLKQNGIVRFFAEYVELYSGKIKHLLAALGVLLPRQIVLEDMTDRQLYPLLKTALSRILRNRDKLPQYNTVDDALSLIANSKRIVVLSGAGISVSCGIPDFRSRDGIYAQLQRDPQFGDLDDPTDMFHKEVFLRNPRLFYSFAHRIFPSNFAPSPSHRFIKLLEERGQLLRNYSQNIDTLEQLAGIERVLQCHGSFATATCTDPACGYRTNGSDIKDDIFAKRIPDCPRCEERKRKRKGGKDKAAKRSKGNGQAGGGGSRKASSRHDDSDDDEHDDGLAYGIMKPDITFFGEKLSNAFDRALLADRESVDLLIVMGTSLKVAPVSELVSHIPHSTPVILINQAPVYHIAVDIMLLGEADRIVDYICTKLGWTLPRAKPVKEVVGDDVVVPAETDDERSGGGQAAHGHGKAVEEPERLLDSHVWLFAGAEPGRLPQLLAADDESEDGEGGSPSDEEQEEKQAREEVEVQQGEQADTASAASSTPAS